MKRSVFYILCVAMFGFSQNLLAQAGMTVSPGKLYYKLAAGGTGIQKVVVSNPNNKDLEIGVSLNDWDYDSLGNNQTYDAGTLKTSATSWIRIMPGSYFTLRPGEKRELDVVFNVPAEADTEIPVHTAMLFLTQLNPGDGRAADGTSIKVSVRMGIKIYHSFTQSDLRDIEVLNFTDMLPAKDDNNSSGYLELTLHNTGKQWLEGKVKWEILNTQTGEKKKLDDQEIFSLPGDQRLVRQALPLNLAKGKYIATAIINYGDKDELKLVELEFQR
jgi:sporulation-control protein spo0M